jgi:hypothetical protein
MPNSGAQSEGLHTLDHLKQVYMQANQQMEALMPSTDNTSVKQLKAFSSQNPFFEWVR